MNLPTPKELEKLSYDSEMALLGKLFERQNKRFEEKAKGLSDNEFVSSYLERPFVEEEMAVLRSDTPTSTKMYQEDELRWHRGDVTAAAMVMVDVCSANQTISMLQALIRLIAAKQFNGVDMKSGEYWSDFAESLIDDQQEVSP